MRYWLCVLDTYTYLTRTTCQGHLVPTHITSLLHHLFLLSHLHVFLFSFLLYQVKGNLCILLLISCNPFSFSIITDESSDICPLIFSDLLHLSQCTVSSELQEFHNSIIPCNFIVFSLVNRPLLHFVPYAIEHLGCFHILAIILCAAISKLYICPFTMNILSKIQIASRIAEQYYTSIHTFLLFGATLSNTQSFLLALHSGISLGRVQ